MKFCMCVKNEKVDSCPMELITFQNIIMRAWRAAHVPYNPHYKNIEMSK
jgi:hypothetical protein